MVDTDEGSIEGSSDSLSISDSEEGDTLGSEEESSGLGSSTLDSEREKDDLEENQFSQTDTKSGDNMDAFVLPVMPRIKSEKADYNLKLAWAGGATPGQYQIACITSGVPITLILDSGAACSIIGVETYRQLPPQERPTLTPCEGNLMSASGDPIDVYGRADFQFTTAKNIKINQTCYVANLPSGLHLLGADFLNDATRNIVINWSQRLMAIDLDIVEIDFLQASVITKVCFVDKICVPPNSECVLRARVTGGRWNAGHESGFFDPSRSFQQRRDISLAASLLTPDEGGWVQMRVANASENLVSIRQGECAGYLQSDSNIVTQDLDSSVGSRDPMEALSEELDEAFPEVLALREEPLLERPMSNPWGQAKLVTETYEPVLYDSVPDLLEEREEPITSD
jgi:hypothetical protein